MVLHNQTVVFNHKYIHFLSTDSFYHNDAIITDKFLPSTYPLLVSRQTHWHFILFIYLFFFNHNHWHFLDQNQATPNTKYLVQVIWELYNSLTRVFLMCRTTCTFRAFFCFVLFSAALQFEPCNVTVVPLCRSSCNPVCNSSKSSL